MDIEALRLLLILSRTLNFTQASALAFMSQPAFSRRISQVENSLGVKIFSRTTHDVSITPDGEKLLPEIRKIVDLYDSMIARCRDIADGYSHLRIGYSVYPFGLGFCMKVENVLSSLHSDVTAEVSFMPHEDSLKALEDGVIDGLVSVDILDEIPMLEKVRLQPSRLYAVVNCLNPLSSRESLTVGDLRGEKIILSGKKSMPALFSARYDYLVENGIGRESVIEADTAREAMMMASRGEGITILNEEGHINTIDTLRPVPLVCDMAELDFVFSWMEGNETAALRKYIAAVRTAAGEVGEGGTPV